MDCDSSTEAVVRVVLCLMDQIPVTHPWMSLGPGSASWLYQIGRRLNEWSFLLVPKTPQVIRRQRNRRSDG